MELRLDSLLSEGEGIAEFVTSAHYRPLHCIYIEGSTDAAGMLEETLHRILDAGGTEEDAYRILGAEIPSPEEMDEITEFDEYIPLDLQYVIRGCLMAFGKQADQQSAR